MGLKERLKELRNEKGLSALSLAEKLGKAESTLRMWEIGKSKPDLDTLIELSKIFSCSTDYLLGLSDFKDKQEEKIFLTKHRFISESIEQMESSQQKIVLDVFLHIISGYTYLNDTFSNSLIVQYSDTISAIAIDIASCCQLYAMTSQEIAVLARSIAFNYTDSELTCLQKIANHIKATSHERICESNEKLNNFIKLITESTINLMLGDCKNTDIDKIEANGRIVKKLKAFKDGDNNARD